MGRTVHVSLAGRGRHVQWAALAAATVLAVFLLELIRLPAALLLGAMVAAMAAGAAEATIRVPDRLFFVSHAVVGCLIARSFTPSLVGELSVHWPLFLAGSLSVLAASVAIGWLLARWQVLPGTTAVWGSAPGAATAISVIAEAYGADIRLVAFMQYLRVVCVAVVASVVAAVWAGPAATPTAALVWFPAIAWLPWFGTAALIALGALVAPQLPVPGGTLLLPLAAGAALQISGTMSIELPPWLLAASYALIGWTIGLRFTRPILAHAARALPRVLAAILCLVAVCGGLGWVLSAWAGVDPLAAYLATTPGGADSVAIIAASAHVDMSFVMAMQTARFLAVLFLGPSLSRLVARFVPPPKLG